MDLKAPLSLSPPFCCSKLPCEEGCHLLWMPNIAQQRLFEDGCYSSFSPCAAEETLRFCHSACRLVACCFYDWWPANWTPKFTKDGGWCLITVTAFWGFAVSLLLPEGEANSVKIRLSNLWVIRVKHKFGTWVINLTPEALVRGEKNNIISLWTIIHGPTLVTATGTSVAAIS